MQKLSMKHLLREQNNNSLITNGNSFVVRILFIIKSEESMPALYTDCCKIIQFYKRISYRKEYFAAVFLLHQVGHSL